LRALDYAHRRRADDGRLLGIVHRDVSPSNVLLSVEGEVKLCDFGIAHANEVVEERATSDEAIKGKAGYMSPEQARGDAVDARSDVFSAGILLWELASGHRMYKPSSDVPLLEQARRAEVKTPEDRGIPEQAELNRIIMRALEKEPDKRYASAGDLLRDLEGYMANAKLAMSPLKLGEWMEAHFGAEILSQRRAREQALSAQSLPPMPSVRSAVEGAGKTQEELNGPSSLVAATVDLKEEDEHADEIAHSEPPRDLEYEAKKKRLMLLAAALLVVIIVIVVLSRRQ
jgi:serine/threonine-protein kinase